MADSLVLTGVKDVKKQTGTEMLLTRPKRGGDSHLVKEWWRNGVSTVYANCTIFDVTTGAGTVKLVLDTGVSTNVRIDHDGAFNFTFIRPNELRRGALYTEDMQLIEHYVFPAISGGKVMTVTPPGSASRPVAGPPATSIGTVTVSGATTASDGDTESYSVTPAGDAGGLTYSWSVTGDGVANGSTTGSTFNVDLSTGSATVTCQVSSSDAGVTDSPASGSISVTIT